MDWVAIGKWAAPIIAAIIAAGIAFKFTIDRRKSSKSSVRITSQKNNKAGGDIIGGDSVKKNAK
ncbi:hypothetical protein KAK06_14810 [Ideonella sp. 4Y11]|uniref:Uncharacterized protein n=1 Tax=Ideonella aquatica TaxID=2824119 RepID=A0A941BKS8_9BURK|nr:hypothetical protein [Ideonella aquatica]MBQ0960223.1 hypothetical protein [Ideonella aquatica]